MQQSKLTEGRTKKDWEKVLGLASAITFCYHKKETIKIISFIFTRCLKELMQCIFFTPLPIITRWAPKSFTETSQWNAEISSVIVMFQFNKKGPKGSQSRRKIIPENQASEVLRSSKTCLLVPRTSALSYQFLELTGLLINALQYLVANDKNNTFDTKFAAFCYFYQSLMWVDLACLMYIWINPDMQLLFDRII